MRRRLIGVFVAISTMVSIAFVLPLAVLVHRTAEDGALDEARADAAALVPVLVSEGSAQQLESAMSATGSGREGRMTIGTPTGEILGLQGVTSERLDHALETGMSDIGSTSGGVEVVRAVSSGQGELWGVRVFVPTERLHRGRTTAWASLAGVAIGLIAISVAVADQLARSVVHPAQRLAAAAKRLGAGELDTRVTPEGPPELVDLSNAFNDLGSQVSSMLARERELVAELSHRLRTPLTKLRMRTEQVADAALADDLRRDLDDVTSTVNQLIAEARNTLGQVAAAECDASRVLVDRFDFWSALAEDQGRPFTFEPAAESGVVALSANDLAAAIDVLLDNAFTHTTETTAVTVGSTIGNDSIAIWIEDDGQGLSSSSAERGVSTVGSTGLGLDIARRTAVRGGGTFGISDRLHGGTRIEMQMPIV